MIREARFAPQRRPAPFRVEVASSLDDLAEYWPTTAAHGGARCYPFQCADVLQVWCETIGRARGIEPVFAAVFAADGRPALLFPLGIEQSGGMRILRFLDCGVSDYNAPVVFPEAAGELHDMRAVWEHLQSSLPPFDLAVLEKMPDTIDDAANPLAEIATASHPASGHGVTLDAPWEEFAKKRLPRWSDSRRCLRNLEKRGAVTFEIARTEREQRKFLEALFRQKRRRFRETEALDFFDEPGVSEFYTESTRRGADCGVLLSALKLDGRILAANWGFIAGERYYDLMTSNEGGEFRTYAPGRLLNEWLLEWCIGNGIRISDFGIGDESYKYRYCDIHTPLRDAYVAVTLRGALYARALQVQAAAKQMLRDTRIGTALKAARNRLYRLGTNRPIAGERLPAWIALIGSVSLAIDA